MSKPLWSRWQEDIFLALDWTFLRWSHLPQITPCCNWTTWWPHRTLQVAQQVIAVLQGGPPEHCVN